MIGFLDKHKDDEEVQQALEKGFIEPLRIVRAIHFHNYANDWYMDIECTANEIMALIPRDIEFCKKPTTAMSGMKLWLKRKLKMKRNALAGFGLL